jgi:hypothetical protein
MSAVMTRPSSQRTHSRRLTLDCIHVRSSFAVPRLKTRPETQIDEIADGIFRVSTGVAAGDIPGWFSFNRSGNG